MQKNIMFKDLDVQISLSNESETEYGLFSSGYEKGTTFDDISMKIEISDFCSMSADELYALQSWLRQNAEIHMRAAVQERNEIEERIEAEREKRYALSRQKMKQENKRKEGYVYLVAADNGLHKIGKTKHVDDRVNFFGIKLPVKTWLVHSFKSEQYDKAEIQLHQHFSEKRSHGEWFELSPEDVQYICSIQDGQL